METGGGGGRFWNAGEDPSTASAASFWDYLTGTSEMVGSSFATTNNNSNPSETTRLLGGAPGNQTTTTRRPTTHRTTDGEEDILETPDFLRQSQERLDEELDRIAIKTVYDTALQHSREYVQTLRILFLRAERFDAAKAAIRIVSFFEAKLRLFGPGIVGRPIQQSDLDRGDVQALRSGCFQFLPSRDKSHRTVLCYFPNYHLYTRIENMVKAWWYLAMAMVEDDDRTPRKHLQRQGIVLLIQHNIGTVQLAEVDRALFWEGVCSLKQLPIRISGGVHYCFNDFMIRQMVSMYTYYNWAAATEDGGDGGQPPWEKLQYHDGSHTECRYNFLKLGFPVEELPVSDEEELESSIHLEWLRQRKSREPGHK